MKITELPAPASIDGTERIVMVKDGGTKAGAIGPYVGAQVQAKIAGQIGELGLVALENATYSHAIVSGNGYTLALIEKATGKWNLALADDAILPAGLPSISMFGGAVFESIPDSSGWAFPIYDAQKRLLGGWRRDGKFVASLADDAIFPAALTQTPTFAGASFESIPDASGWAFPIYDVNKNLLGGWRRDGKLVAALSEDSLLPSSATLAGIAANLAAANMGIPSGRLFFSGDSMTAGAGGNGTTYPAIMAAALGLSHVNTGVGGTGTASIAVRQGGRAMLLTLTGNALPADTSEVNVTAYSADFTNDQSAQTWPGYILDAGGNKVLVTLTRYGVSGNAGVTDHYTLRRQVAGAGAVTVLANSRFFADIFGSNELDTHYIWAGRNNISATRSAQQAIVSDILSMIDRVKHDRFGVLQVCNGLGETTGTANYNSIKEINRLIEEAVGPHHMVKQRDYLATAAALADAGITATAQDTSDIAGDTIPASLRFDGVHLTATGYTILGQFVSRWHRGRGWATGI